MGGLDLKRGRWDTPDHHLFQTLEEEHEGDMYQSTAQGRLWESIIDIGFGGILY